MGQVVGQECSKADDNSSSAGGKEPSLLGRPTRWQKSEAIRESHKSGWLELPDDENAEIESMRENQLLD